MALDQKFVSLHSKIKCRFETVDDNFQPKMLLYQQLLEEC